MPNLTVTSMTTAVRDRTVTNVTNNQPLTDPRILRELNAAYSDIFDYVATSTTKATHATFWSTAAATGATVLLGQVIAKEVLRVFRTATSGSLGAPSDFELDRMELPELTYRRRNPDLYAETQAYALERIEPAAAANVNMVNIHLYPDAGATQIYFPVHYVKARTDLVNGSDVPDVAEGLQWDIVYIAAARLCPEASRHDLVPLLRADISAVTRDALESRDRAWLEPKRRPGEHTT